MAFASAPEGFRVIAGDAAAPVIGSDGVITITSGKQAVVHWDKFSIGKDTVVKFAQADRSSAILNRVIGSAESRIDGALLSNGKVFLVNKNGVVVGPNGRIETAGFIASTLDFGNDDFLKGKELLFNGDLGQKVVNLGKIVAHDGDIALIGPSVDNQGTLSAPQGHVLMGCGQEILLQPSGEQRIFIRIPASGVLEHSGTIEALVAEMKSGVTPFAKAIKSSGRIDALAAVEEGGKVFLVAETGQIEVAGPIVAKQGGLVHVLGKEIYLQDGAEIDVSGNHGGGEILIGGDYQGSNPDIFNGDISYVAKNATLRANAKREGDGGKVIIWAEKATGFFGNIEACGGSESGNGGLIEVSGLNLTFEGMADAKAPKGLGGTLLLDPEDIVISNGTDTCPTCWSGGSYSPDVACTNPNVINVTTLNSMLASFSTVTINTNSPCSNSTNGGSITVAPGTAINWTTNTFFHLISNTSTTISGTVTQHNAAFMITAGDCIFTPTATFNITGDGFIDINCVNFTSNGATSTSPVPSQGIALLTTGNVTLTNSTHLIIAGGNERIGGNLKISSGSELQSNGVLELRVGGTGSITGGSSITQTDGGDLILIFDNDNPSSPNIGSQNPMLTIDGTSSVTNTGGLLYIYTATREQNSIASTAILGNGTLPNTFTPGPSGVDSATEVWSTYFPNGLAGRGTPFTFFYKDNGIIPPSPPPPSPPPAPPTTAAALAVQSNAVGNTAVTNLITTQQSSLALITTTPPTSGGQAIPLTQNENQNPQNDAMSQAQCP